MGLTNLYLSSKRPYGKRKWIIGWIRI